MVQYLPTYVKAPAFTPLPYGLMSVTQMVTDDVDKVHWRNGVQFQPDSCESANVTLAQCPVVTGYAKDVTGEGLPAKGSQAFTVYADIECSPVGNYWEEAVARATAALTNGEARAVERVFWTGDADTPSGANVYPHLAANSSVYDDTTEVLLQPAATTIVTGAVDIVEAIGLLESELAECYGGVGVIHAPRAALAHMAANHLLEKSGQMLRTVGGTPIAFGAGYSGTSPAGETPAAGTAWLYATGAVALRRGEVFITSDRTAALDRNVNTLRLFAERTYVVSWDCCLLAIPVSLGGVVTGSPNSAT